jgi:predicted phage tail protein
MVEVELHGILAEKVKKTKWNLAVNSVGEAIRAIEANTRILYKTLYELEKDNLKYRVLINKKDFKIFKNPDETDYVPLMNAIHKKGLKLIKTRRNKRKDRRSKRKVRKFDSRIQFL